MRNRRRLLRLSGLRVQLHTQRIYHLEDGRKAGIAFAGQRFVKAFTSQPGFTGKLAHATGARDIAQCLGDEGRVITGFL